MSGKFISLAILIGLIATIAQSIASYYRSRECRAKSRSKDLLTKFRLSAEIFCERLLQIDSDCLLDYWVHSAIAKSKSKDADGAAADRLSELLCLSRDCYQATVLVRSLNSTVNIASSLLQIGRYADAVMLLSDSDLAAIFVEPDGTRKIARFPIGNILSEIDRRLTSCQQRMERLRQIDRLNAAIAAPPKTRPQRPTPPRPPSQPPSKPATAPGRSELPLVPPGNTNWDELWNDFSASIGDSVE